MLKATIQPHWEAEVLRLATGLSLWGMEAMPVKTMQLQSVSMRPLATGQQRLAETAKRDCLAWLRAMLLAQPMRLLRSELLQWQAPEPHKEMSPLE